MKKLIFIISLILILTGGQAVATTLSTLSSVPSPGGNFDAIFIDGDAGVVEGAACSTPGELDMNTSNELFVCSPGNTYRRVGVWIQNGDNVYLADATPNDTYVGIGTSTPTFKLHLMTDGGILAEGIMGDGPLPPNLGTGTRLMWNTNKSVFRAGSVTGTDWDDVNTALYTAGFGRDSKVSGSFSVVGGGDNNEVNSEYSVIGGGQGNLITDTNTPDEHAVIVGGLNNAINQGASFIGGGDSNTIGNSTGGYNSVIVGGRSNTIVPTGILGVIVGGTNNSAGTLDFVGGGSANTTNSGLAGVGSTIVGGESNSINNGLQAGFIGGGQLNNLAQHWATIPGGHHNEIHSYAVGGVIGGGGWNIADAADFLFGGYPVIAGGRDNDTAGDYAFIGGGYHNQVTGDYASVVGGGNSTAANANEANGDYSFVGGGSNNVTNATGTYASVLGGLNNTASGTHSVVPGGADNQAQGTYSLAGGRHAVATGNNTFIWAHDAASDVTVTENDRFIIATGLMGVGTTDAHDDYRATFTGDVLINGKLTVTGDVEANTLPPAESDRELKDNIAPLTGSLEKIKHIAGVSYTWKKDGVKGQRETGIIAQDVETVFPDMVTVNYRGNKAVYYHRLVAPLIEAIKELDDKVNDLQEENMRLKERINHLTH